MRFQYTSIAAPVLFAVAMLGACSDGDNNTDNNTTNNTTQDMTSQDMASQDMVADTSKDSGGSDMSSDQSGVCENISIYPDADGDGYGTSAMPKMVCLKPNEAPEDGFARLSGDCADTDPLQHDKSEGVCGDNVDDDCDGKDEACPTSMPAQMNIPNWDCTGTPPDNVYAWATFQDGKGYFEAGGCFMFFQGGKDAFYVKRVNLKRSNTDPSCDTKDGCTCPSLNGWKPYDRRLYAMTRSDDADCPELAIRDHAGEEQAVSNSCRKYLYQLHFYDIEYSFVAATKAHLDRRIAAFPTVEIACLEDSPHRNLPYATLLTFPIQKNENFKPLE